MDMGFEKVRYLVPIVEVNTTAAREHVRAIKKNRHVKERVGTITSKFPFALTPVMVLIHTVYVCVFWLNAFPSMSENYRFSPGEVVTGLTIDFNRDCKVDVGSYVCYSEYQCNYC